MKTEATKTFRGVVSKAAFPRPEAAPRRIVHERCNVILLALGSEKGELVASGIVLDIGAAGVGLIVDSEIRPDTQVIIEIQSTRIPCRIPAKVVWYGKLPSCDRIIKDRPGYIWRMGLRIGPCSDEELELVTRLVAGL